MKTKLSGHPSDNDDDIITAVDQFLEVWDAVFYKEGIRMLHNSWNKCVNVGRDYAESTMF